MFWLQHLKVTFWSNSNLDGGEPGGEPGDDAMRLAEGDCEGDLIPARNPELLASGMGDSGAW